MLPIYRAPSTTDWIRILLVCVLHPIVHEFVMTMTRLNTHQAHELAMNDPKRHYFALVAMNAAFGLEGIFVMYRRCMLGSMRDPSAVVLAIVLTALEEAILRSTMVYRYVVLLKYTVDGAALAFVSCEEPLSIADHS